MELTEEQAKVVEEALDLYLRVGMGQLRTVASVLALAYLDIGVDDQRRAEHFIDMAKATLFRNMLPGVDVNYGVMNPALPKQFKRAMVILDALKRVDFRLDVLEGETPVIVKEKR